VEEVCVRRIVHDNNIFHIAAKQGKIFDVGALEAEAVLAVETHRDQGVLVKCVHQWVRVDAHRGCVEHDLVDRGKLLEEEENAWPNQYVHLNRSPFYRNSHLKIASASGTTRPKVRFRKLGVDQRFVEIKDESFAATELSCLGRDDRIVCGHGLLSEASSAL